MNFADYLFVAGVLVYAGGLLFDFRLSLALLPLFFPLYLWKLSFGVLPLNFVEILVLLAAARWAWQLLGKKRAEVWDKNFWIDWGWWLLALILLASAGVYQASQTGLVILPYESKEFDSLKVALGIWKSWIILPIMFFAMWKNVLDNNWYKKVSWYAYLFSAVILSLWALWQVITGEFITIDGRASGPFVSANYLSLYIGPAVLGVLLQLWQNWSDLKKSEIFLNISFFAICFVALVASRSYASFVAVIAGAMFYIVCKFTSWKKIVSGGLVILVLAGIFLFFQKDTEKFRLFFEFNQRSSSAVRVQTWTVAKNLIGEHWFEGIGLGQFEAQYQLQAKDILGKEPYEVTQLHPHNIFLSFWLNLGVFGFLFLVGLIWKVLRMKRADSLLFLSLFVLLLVHGLFDQPFWKNDLSLLWWMLIAFL